MVTIGSSVEGVRAEIHRLQVLGYREATTWSKLLPTPKEGQYMSITTRYRVMAHWLIHAQTHSRLDSFTLRLMSHQDSPKMKGAID